ncbi:hypothetical protein [Phaeobacter sp. 11ANDIMAR09]|uniref:hypothetical protein n=1 Tax=Phaeobacter sp. 11ANDIMAR09 TaxID=1225647 RepID=UPI0006C89F19|nr:hypothetical protein [Phaeobacter sp. 11ANDIMAR09]KPD11142.1 hypothetical protein AN476_17400 [Phaeobacter sp. 11ANDIMAR09]
MFEGLIREARFAALKRCLKKLSPGRFAYDISNDFYTPILKNSNSGQSLLVDRISGCSIYGRLWKNDEFAEPDFIEICELERWEIEVRRFYGGFQSNYHGSFQFWAYEALCLTEIAFFLDRLRQSYFNKRLKFRNDRIEVLQKFVAIHLREQHGEGPGTYTPQPRSIVDLEMDFFGSRIFSHPDNKEILAKFRLLVESLVLTGDLEKSNHIRFKLSPKAVVTLSEFALEERRHKDSFRLSRRMYWATFVIAAATLFQAYIAASSSESFKAWFPPSFPDFFSSGN